MSERVRPPKTARQIIAAYWFGAPKDDPYRTPAVFRVFTVLVFGATVVILSVSGVSTVVVILASAAVFLLAQIAVANVIASRQGPSGDGR